MRTQNFAEGFSRQAPLEMINPLLSQPVVELCLSIPSWKWIKGGRDRAVARQAFSNMLPDAIVTRRTKGGPSAFYRQIVEHYRDAMRERLLGGELARRGIVDRVAVEAFFASPIDEQGHAYVRVLDLSDAEAWVTQRTH